MGGKTRQRKPVRMQGAEQFAETDLGISRSLMSRRLISPRLLGRQAESTRTPSRAAVGRSARAGGEREGQRCG
jgi:hypothetical protein